MRSYMLLVAAVLAAVGPVGAVRLRLPQTPSAQSTAARPGTDTPAFEVATVKPNKSAEFGSFIRRQPGGRFNATNMPLRQLIVFAYQIRPFQLEGGASLLDERYDIVAKAEGDPPQVLPGTGPDQLMLMLRALLAERFKLAMHNETKELPIYALVLSRSDGRLGSQLKVSSTDCAALAEARRRGGPAPAGPPPAPPKPGEIPQCGVIMGRGNVAMGGFPLSQFANSLSNLVQRVVVDRTGLTGLYDLSVQFTPDQAQGPPGLPPPGVELPSIDPNGPSLFTALQEQLGLKLESTRGPVEMYVIDHIEQPAAD